MIEWITVISLILLGIGLIIVEIIFVPGTTFVGVIGFACSGVGIYLGFKYFGEEVGWYVALGSAIAGIVILVYTFRSKTWERFSLNSSIDSKVNEGGNENLTVGQTGITISSLRPIGKAEFGDKEYEVKSFGEYMESGVEVE
ncbi:MAG: hypothetical protein OEY34_01230, partial [Cyclobacteriaceae bacterium]|nr:hypothetical protein [Cyclobacteriaceae bacterium]